MLEAGCRESRRGVSSVSLLLFCLRPLFESREELFFVAAMLTSTPWSSLVAAIESNCLSVSSWKRDTMTMEDVKQFK